MLNNRRLPCPARPLNGFSLLEFVSVIAIISILAVMAYPVFSSTSEASLSGAVEIVKSDIRLTQINAMTRGAPGSINFTAGSGRYRYDNDGSVWLSRDLSAINSAVAINNDTVISFNSLGEPLSVSAFTVTVTLSGISRTLTIEPFTGKVVE